MNQSEVLSIIEQYKRLDNGELEFRIPISTPQIFQTVLEKFFEEHEPIYEQNINIITDRESKTGRYRDTIRHTISYTNGRANRDMGESYMRKSKVHGIDYKTKYFNCSLILSDENEIEEQSDEGCKLFILKVRASVTIEAWRYDFTISREIPRALQSEVRTYMYMMKKMNSKKFSELIDEDGVKLSIEIEHDITKKDILGDAEVIEVISSLLEMIDPDYKKNIELQAAIFTAARYLRPKIATEFRMRSGLKRLLPQVETLTKSIYLDEIFPQIEEFYITIKADGERCLALITNSTCQIIKAKELIEVNVQCEDEGITLIDGELVMINNQPQIIPIDVPILRNKELYHQGFEYRHDGFEEARHVLGMYVGPNKSFKPLTKQKASKIIRKLADTQPEGLIFIRIGQSYTETKTYKFKFETTIDFLVRRVPDVLHGRAPYLIRDGYVPYILFCGISHHRFRELKLNYVQGYTHLFPINSRRSTYFPIQFCPNDFPRAYLYYHPENENLDNKIVEFKYDIPEGGSVINGKWVVQRVREDRQTELQQGNYFGNDYNVAVTNWNNLSNPITVDFLCDPTKDVYFKEKKSDAYIGLTKFTGYIKSSLIRIFRQSKWVLDLGCGKGQDLFKYGHHGIHNVLFIDNDKTAISELRERSKVDRFKNQIDFRIYTHVADLTRPYVTTYTELLEFEMPKTGVDGIVCNFALHYFIIGSDQLKNIIKLVYKMLKYEGRFTFTILDGQQVHQLLERKEIGKNESLDIYDGNDIKYSIRRLYSAKKLANYKHQIELILPFTAGDYYKETLVDVEFIIKQFEANGFERELYYSFKKMFPRFEKHQPGDADLVTDEDYDFASLYSYVTLYKLPRTR